MPTARRPGPGAFCGGHPQAGEDRSERAPYLSNLGLPSPGRDHDALSPAVFSRALIVLLAALAAACASEEERFQEHMARAEAYHEAGKFEEAIIELRSALKLQPENALVNERIADISRESGSFDHALFFYREAQRLDPKRIEPLLGEFPLVLGTDLERAAEIIRLALEVAPDEPRVQQRRSELALAGGDTDNALAAAMSAVELAPDDPASHLGVGVVYQAKLREQRIAGNEPPEEFYGPPSRLSKEPTRATIRFRHGSRGRELWPAGPGTKRRPRPRSWPRSTAPSSSRTNLVAL
jgi:tetratricopeptide (TPR) repeat protein